ncbi:MAG: MBL fold metallo-hydrolase [Eubacteriales bacterium]|nr:MBL fold metallo-hydrolase [Eubacteriales bacterium]MDY3332817.1 MBL fold metallo-hydrolase [Gallibacter sp.]
MNFNIRKIMSGPLAANSYLVWNNDTKEGFIIDPGAYNATMKNLIEEENINLKYIILTHGHCDHIGGVLDIKKIYGSEIIASEAEIPMLSDVNYNMSREMLGVAVEFVPDIIIDGDKTLQLCSADVEFIMTPGHTEGGMSILLGDVLFSGDTLFRESIGRTDFRGGDFDVLMSSIKEKLFALHDDTKVCPGHMGSTTIGHEKEYNPFV